MRDDPYVEAEEFDTAWRESIVAQKSTFTTLLRDGVITEDTFSQLIGEVDSALADPEINWGAFSRDRHLPKIDYLMTAIVQQEDTETAVNALNKNGLSVTRLPSLGGLLEHRNVTLLIGIPRNQERLVVQTLENNCHRRINYTQNQTHPNPVNVGRATVFTFEVERYEEL
jgi:uncharacterized protein YaaQ